MLIGHRRTLTLKFARSYVRRNSWSLGQFESIEQNERMKQNELQNSSIHVCKYSATNLATVVAVVVVVVGNGQLFE